jgi:site-specific DNA recombinase
MQTIQAAIYARVSSERQATAQTIASQLAALRERVAADGCALPEAMQFLDDGYSGTTLVRPALERLRDLVAAGAVDRLYIHSPDRLARKYAYQVLLVDEFRRTGVEVIFLNRELGRSPEDDLLLQVQGMMAEYERAKIVERHRRGKLHAARAGVVNVLAGAPYGYRYIDKHAGGGQARYEILPDEARVVRQVFDWIGRDRLTIGEVCRRLTQAGERTRTRRTVWERSVVGGILHNPAYQGTAAFGKTRQGPLRPRLRAQRGRPLQPRRATADYGVPASEWLPIPVPALVDPSVFAAVQEQLQDNRRHARQSRRGARYLLQGLVQCQQCGYAFYGKPISRTAAKGTTRTYAYYRCVGTDAYRFGGERVCTNPQVRTDLLDLTVWREVSGLLAHPERVAEEYQRRLQAPTSGTRQAQATLETQLGKVRQGVARLIDSYAEGLLEKHEFEPRLTRLRQRIAALEEQRQQLLDEAAVQTELRLIIGRLEDFATQIDTGLAEADWLRKREMIRALVKRVEVTQDQVNVVFRVDSYQGESDPEKKSLQLRRGSRKPNTIKHLHGQVRQVRPRNAHARIYARKTTGRESGILPYSQPGKLLPKNWTPRKGRKNTQGNATTSLRKPRRCRIEEMKIPTICR